MKTKTHTDHPLFVRRLRCSWSTADGAICHSRAGVAAQSRNRLRQAIRRYYQHLLTTPR